MITEDILKNSLSSGKSILDITLFESSLFDDICNKYFGGSKLILKGATLEQCVLQGTLATAFLNIKGMHALLDFSEKGLIITLSKFNDFTLSGIFPSLLHSLYDDFEFSKTTITISTITKNLVDPSLEENYGLPLTEGSYEIQHESFYLQTTVKPKVKGHLINESMVLQGAVELVNNVPRFELQTKNNFSIKLFEKSYNFSLSLVSLGTVVDGGGIVGGQGLLALHTDFGSADLRGLMQTQNAESITLMAQNLSFSLADVIAPLGLNDSRWGIENFDSGLVCSDFSFEFSFSEKKMLMTSLSIETGKDHVLIPDLINLESAKLTLTHYAGQVVDKVLSGNISLDNVELFGEFQLAGESFFCCTLSEVSLTDFINKELSLSLPLPELTCKELDLSGNKKNNTFDLTATLNTSWNIANTNFEVKNQVLHYQRDNESSKVHIMGDMILGNAQFHVSYDGGTDNVLRGELNEALSLKDLISSFSAKLEIPELTLNKATFSFDLSAGTFVLYGDTEHGSMFVVGVNKDSWSFACGVMSDSIYDVVKDLSKQKIPLLKNIKDGCLIYSGIDQDISELLDQAEVPLFAGENIKLGKDIVIYGQIIFTDNLKTLTGLDKVLCSMSLDSHPQLTADLDNLRLTLGKETITIEQAQLVFSEKFFNIQGGFTFLLGHQPVQLDITLTVEEEGVSASCDLKGSLKPPLGLNIIVKDFAVSLGIDFINPGITMGAELKFTMENTSTENIFAFVFDFGEVIQPILLDAKFNELDFVSMFSLISKKQSLLLPDFFSALILKDFSFCWAEQDGLLPDGTTPVTMGFSCCGLLQINAFKGAALWASVILSESKIESDVQMSPLTFSKILSISGKGKAATKDGTKIVKAGGPFLLLSNLNSPFIQGSADIELLGYSESVDMLFGDSGLTFDVYIQLSRYCQGKFSNTINDNGLSVSGDFSLDVSVDVPLNLDVVSTTIHLDVDVDIIFTITLIDKVQIISANGKFKFEGINFSFHFEWDENLNILYLKNEIENKIVADADNIFKALKNLGKEALDYAKKEFTKIDDDAAKEIGKIEDIGKDALNDVKNASKDIAAGEKEAGQVINQLDKDVVNISKNAENVASAIANTAKKDVDKLAGEASSIIANAMVAIGQLDKETNVIISDLGSKAKEVLADALKYSTVLADKANKDAQAFLTSANNDAKKILNDAKKVVDNIDRETKKLFGSVKKVAKKVGGAVKHAYHKAKHWLKHLF